MQNLGAEKIDLLAGQQVALLYKDEIQKQAPIQSDALIIRHFQDLLRSIVPRSVL